MAFGFSSASGFRQCGMAIAAASVFFCAASLLAQGTPAPNTAASGKAPTVQAPATVKHVSKKHKKKPDPAPPVVAFQPPPPPPPPNWPANNQPQPAAVGWDGRVLSVTATNSSLLQILRDISTATGVQMDGMSKDQRVFGNYGPAPARDVLEKLLDGSGYNVIMIGDKGQGEPRELVLTAKGNLPAGNPSQAQAPQQGNDEEAPEDPEPPEQPGDQPPNRRPFTTPPQQPGSGRTPQQVMEEMQQRQQQLQQQLQNNGQPGQPATPPATPPNE
ncbi:hypothetical protein [Acidicapsa ligni]|uniref:hypothetical protein n=1 Tax=Acidicapsa ligni TaxID=542300 RepID=UPI0021DF8343|nr:hypothetical protein [Acidicapsa ligni]